MGGLIPQGEGMNVEYQAHVDYPMSRLGWLACRLARPGSGQSSYPGRVWCTD